MLKLSATMPLSTDRTAAESTHHADCGLGILRLAKAFQTVNSIGQLTPIPSWLIAISE